ncbi:hypothetical protein FHR59_002323 [Xanthomonas arboricola]|nr:hypothetical protein [Xanthomonas euroxanthea]MBB6338060.1 hypothetical protein [Xanthomonas arboricola]
MELVLAKALNLPQFCSVYGKAYPIVPADRFP